MNDSQTLLPGLAAQRSPLGAYLFQECLSRRLKERERGAREILYLQNAKSLPLYISFICILH